MEDLKAYIESGILEMYVFGDLPEAERMHVEEMLAKHPEVKAEVAEIEKVLELTSDAYGIEPSENVREKTFNLLFPANVEPEKPEATVHNLNVRDDKVIYLKPNNFYKYGFAASIILLAGSVAAIVSLTNKLKDTHSQLIAATQQNQTFANQVNFLDKKLESSTSMLGIYRNPDYKLVKLAGTAFSPKSAMTVAWNPKASKVIIDKQSLALPQNDAEHQYQLWALVDGKPVNLGVFDAGKDSAGVQNMKSIAIAQAFAVTLEPRGGSASPTMDQMMVMGAAASAQ